MKGLGNIEVRREALDFNTGYEKLRTKITVELEVSIRLREEHDGYRKFREKRPNSLLDVMV